METVVAASRREQVIAYGCFTYLHCSVKLGQLFGWHYHPEVGRMHRCFEICCACRAQGYGWLVGEDFSGRVGVCGSQRDALDYAGDRCCVADAGDEVIDSETKP